MQLTDEDILEFAAVWREEFGEEISEVEARRQASQLIQLYTLLIRPLRPEATDPKVEQDHSYEVLPLLPEID